jgi:hypothetical protein
MPVVNIFISYSHEDEIWKDRLLSHLRVLERQGAADVWDASDLQAGADWAKEIKKAVRQSDIAVLLISPYFFASDFIVTEELPALLKRRHKEGLAVIPILVRPTFWSAVPEIAELQFANDPSRPLSEATEVERDIVYAHVSQQIADLVHAVAQRSATRAVLGPPRPGHPDPKVELIPPVTAAPGHLFVSHSKSDGDFAELLKLKFEREGHDAWVDTDRLGPGLDWRTEIDQAIRDARAVLAIMSPEARASEYVTYEWAFAWGCGTKVIPIMLRQTTLHPRLATLQYLDFTNRIARPWRQLFDVLSTLKDARTKREG